MSSSKRKERRGIGGELNLSGGGKGEAECEFKRKGWAKILRKRYDRRYDLGKISMICKRCSFKIEKI